MSSSIVSTVERYPTGRNYSDPTLKTLLASGLIGGEGASPPDLSGYVTSSALTTALNGIQTNIDAIDGVTEETVQRLIRGNGLFRGLMNVYGNTTMDDTHWQNYVQFPYLAGGAVTLSVQKPTATLGTDTNRFVPVGVTGDAPPAGTWTLLVNPNNTASILVEFPEAGALVTGTNSSGVYATGGTGYALTLPQGRSLFLLYRGLTSYYYTFW